MRVDLDRLDDDRTAVVVDGQPFAVLEAVAEFVDTQDGTVVEVSGPDAEELRAFLEWARARRHGSP